MFSRLLYLQFSAYPAPAKTNRPIYKLKSVVLYTTSLPEGPEKYLIEKMQQTVHAKREPLHFLALIENFSGFQAQVGITLPNF